MGNNLFHLVVVDGTYNSSSKFITNRSKGVTSTLPLSLLLVNTKDLNIQLKDQIMSRKDDVNKLICAAEDQYNSIRKEYERALSDKSLDMQGFDS